MKIKLVYELSDNKKSYIQGYMDSIGFGEITNNDIPNINQEWENIINEEYILLAPFTSSWDERKRSWGYEKYKQLQSLLEDKFGVKCVILENKYSFQEMMSLIRHCKFFVGNDSAPAIIAQSFKKKSFIIFGATRPEYIHLREQAIPIYDKNRHKLCHHCSRQEEVDCCEEFCMERITVEAVLNQIRQNI